MTKSASDRRLRRSDPRRRDRKQQITKLAGVRSGWALRRSRVDIATVLRVFVMVFVVDTVGISSGSRVMVGLEGEGKVEPGAELANRPRRG